MQSVHATLSYRMRWDTLSDTHVDDNPEDWWGGEADRNYHQYVFVAGKDQAGD